ncbi:MAG: RusA family crossover junction endodeoxyribonuclease, partial [Nanoarchaeota archaeon]
MIITLPGEPIAKIRPRICRKFSYDPQEKLKNAAKFQVLDAIQKYKNYFPIAEDCAICIALHFYTAPRAHEENLCEWGITENIFKKDIDNLCKFYLDVMNKIVYEDDRQVHKLTAWKQCSMNPRTEIIIMKEKQTISDKTKKVLCAFSPKLFLKMAHDMGKLADQMLSNTECTFTD